MKASAQQVLAVIALIFAILSFFTPVPLGVAVIVVCVAVLAGKVT